MEEGNWGDTNLRCFGMLIDGRAQSTGVRQPGRDSTLLLVVNAHQDVVQFTLPKCAGGRGWSPLIDTNMLEDKARDFGAGETYQITTRSLLLFELESDSR